MDTLKKMHELLGIKISLQVSSRSSMVQVELESNEGGKPRTLERWTYPVSELGIPRQLPQRGMPDVSLPQSMLIGLSDSIEKFGAPPSQPLWILLMKPYGFLGFVPWEALLRPTLNRPMFRLPDFLERPRENRAVLDVAVCSSAPVSEPAIYPPTLLKEITHRILSSSPRPRTTIHLFADQAFYEELRTTFDGESRVKVHDPAAAASYEQQSRFGEVSDSGRISCPWLRWVRDAMKGRSLDAVHFVCHGYLAQDRPALSVAESPVSNRDAEHAHYVGVSELAAFLTQTGAWAASFADPPDNYTEAGLRLFVDTLAQTRPGPVLYHSIADGTAQGLDEAYAFLFAPEASPPPTLDARAFAYCQPALVNTEVSVSPRAPNAALDLNSELFEDDSDISIRSFGSEKIAGGDASRGLPNWVAAAQRHVESASLELQRRSIGSRAPGSSLEGSVRNSDVANETLKELQEIVGKFARGDV